MPPTSGETCNHLKLDATGLAALITAITSGVLGGLAYWSGRKKDDREEAARAELARVKATAHAAEAVTETSMVLDSWMSLVGELQEERATLLKQIGEERAAAAKARRDLSTEKRAHGETRRELERLRKNPDDDRRAAKDQ